MGDVWVLVRLGDYDELDTVVGVFTVLETAQAFAAAHPVSAQLTDWHQAKEWQHEEAAGFYYTFGYRLEAFEVHDG